MKTNRSGHENMREADVLASQARALVNSIPILKAEVIDRRRPLDKTLHKFFRKHHHYGSRDRRVLADAVFSYFRWLGWTRALFPGDVPMQCLLSLSLDSSGAYPLTTPLSSMTRSPAPGIPPLGSVSVSEKSAALKEYLRLPSPPQPSELVPGWLPDEIIPHDDVVSADKYFLRLVEAFQHRPPVWIRCQHSRADELASILQKKYSPLLRHSSLPDALGVKGPLHLSAQEYAHPWEIQDLASQAVALVCAPLPGENWWDVCAGAGGKALHLADIMHSRGHITATDIRTSALEHLVRRTRRWGMETIIHPHRADATSCTVPRNFYDGVLLDAPCSSIGTWSRNPDARWRTQGSDIVHYASLQLQLLNNVAAAVRPGGRLIYAVCTLTYRETDEVINRFLLTHPEFEAFPFNHPLGKASTSHLCWINPWEGPGDGMFIARLRRCRAIP